jgi:hypothetical protein
MGSQRKRSPNDFEPAYLHLYQTGKVDASHFNEINRGITSAEYADAQQAARAAGLWRFD